MNLKCVYGVTVLHCAGPQLLNVDSQPFFIAQALGVLAAIVAVHEAGHFAAARLQGIHVTKFAIGFGPPLIAFKRGEIEYSLRLIPLGGYVAFPDDDPESKFEPGKRLRYLFVASVHVMINCAFVTNFSGPMPWLRPNV